MSGTRQALPTVPGFAVKCAIAALRECSTDPAPLLRRAGLEGDLGASQRRVSAAAQGEFLEFAALALKFERFFGCPVEFAAPSDQIGFSNEALALPLITEDPISWRR